MLSPFHTAPELEGPPPPAVAASDSESEEDDTPAESAPLLVTSDKPASHGVRIASSHVEEIDDVREVEEREDESEEEDEERRGRSVSDDSGDEVSE